MRIVFLIVLLFLPVAPAVAANEVRVAKRTDSVFQDLWWATVQRSPEVQFAIYRLGCPVSKLLTDNILTENKNRWMETPSAWLSVSACVVASDREYFQQSCIGGDTNPRKAVLLMDLRRNSGTDPRTAKQELLRRNQSIMQSSIVRGVFDKLLTEFANYSRARGQLLQAHETSKVVFARTPTNVDEEYTQRKAVRDHERISDELQLHRSALIELAGIDAVERIEAWPPQQLGPAPSFLPSWLKRREVGDFEKPPSK